MAFPRNGLKVCHKFCGSDAITTLKSTVEAGHIGPENTDVGSVGSTVSVRDPPVESAGRLQLERTEVSADSLMIFGF